LCQTWEKTKLSLHCQPITAFASFAKSAGAILLETQKVSFSERYTYLAWEPVAILKMDIQDVWSKELFAFLKEYKNHFIAGYFSYEMGQWFEKLPPLKEKDTPLPHIYLAAYDRFWAYDHLKKQWWQWFKSRPSKETLKEAQIGVFKGKFLGTNQKKSTYLNRVKAILRYIANGDVYQVNYTQRCYFCYEGNPYSFYLRLARVQPVAYAAFINTGDGVVISGSPELFLRIKGSQVLTKPMKGTRRRGKTRTEDQTLRLALKKSKKDQAENVMIVDLMRNDLGKFCLPGSVKVPRLFVVEAYNTVFQMVSHITGKLRPEIDWSEVLAATFPPGSITGAPKKRAMEIINELEPHQRGVYTGAIGYFFQDKVVLNVAIRTVELFNGEGVLGIGGGIVFDSDPEAEYEESLLKAKATMQALGVE